MNILSGRGTNKIELELTEDFYDKKHVNISGTQKVTGYLSEYIAESYELKDCLNQKQKTRWKKACEEWHAERDELLERWNLAVEEMDGNVNR